MRTMPSPAVTWAREITADPRAVFLDTETTGLDGSAEIIDIAVIDCSGDVLLDTLVRPQRPIPAASSQIHGLLDHHVANAPSWTDVYQVLVPILAHRPVVIYNVDYDRKVMHQCCRQWSLSTFSEAGMWECAMLAYAEFRGIPGWRGRGYRWHKLEAAAKAFGVPPGNHRARADAEACRQVVHRMAES